MAFPVIFCFFLFFLSPFLSSSLNPPLCNSHDSIVLLQFKDSFSLNHSASIECDEFSDDYFDTIQFKNTSYPKTTSWGNDSDCCSWDGITCDSMSGHVIGLDLSCSWLQGQLHPNNSLFQLSHLQALNLAYNDFSGSFMSSQFGDISTLLHLNLSSSSFVGEIPHKIAELSKLISLDLSWNYFFSNEWLRLRLEPSNWEKLILNMTDLRELALDYVDMSSITPSSLSLLMNLSSSLVSLRLSFTELQGNLTSGIFCLENLRQLHLSRNWDLNAQLPKSNWSSPLSFLVLRHTNFFGEVLPDSIGHLKYLNHLDLGYCYFEGHVPLGLRNLTQLTYLDLSMNTFSGEISFLLNLEHLTFLNLAYNCFFGEIHSEISQLSKLVLLDLSSNRDMDDISLLKLEASTWEKLVPNITNLRVLRLDYVNMSSVTPNSLSLLMNLSSSLIDLSLWRTSLQGDITNSLLYLENLKFLYLGENTNVKVQLIPKLNWSSITDLYLDGISFLGEAPDSIGHLSSLKYLSLVSCQFEGPIPSSFKNLTQLTNLDLSSNKFSGGTSILSTLVNLTFLNLSSNKFSGGISFLSTLVNLTSLDLSSNKFSGGISFLSTLVNLTSLDLSNNSFNGQIPSSLSNLAHLYHLYLSTNNFSGEIPDMFGKLSGLQQLKLNNNNFSGQVPSSLSNTSVLILDLSFNMFTGQVPSSLSNTSVIILDLSFNMLHGNILFPFYAQVFLASNNKFGGDISSLFCNAITLEVLNLSHNNLSGPIPQCLVSLPYLSVLDLRMNDFSGTLPSNFSKGYGLQTLNFNSNRLKGSLPLSLAHCSLLEIFDVGHNEIEDTFPSWLDDLPELQVLVLRENKFYGALSSSNTKHPFPKLRIFDISSNHFIVSLPTTYIKKFKGMMKTDNVEAGLQYMGSKDYSAYKDSVMITWKGVTMELQRILTIFTTIDFLLTL